MGNRTWIFAALAGSILYFVLSAAFRLAVAPRPICLTESSYDPDLTNKDNF